MVEGIIVEENSGGVLARDRKDQKQTCPVVLHNSPSLCGNSITLVSYKEGLTSLAKV